jgi:hypothetical protein
MPKFIKQGLPKKRILRDIPKVKKELPKQETKKVDIIHKNKKSIKDVKIN